MTEQPIQSESSRTPRAGRVLSGRLLIFLLVALLGLSIAYLGIKDARLGAGVQVGAAAPAFKQQRYSGGTVSLEELRGQVLMLDFWATWCPPCVAEMPVLMKLAREYESRGLVFLAANRDEADGARAQVGVFIAERAPELAKNVVFADDAMAASYGVDSLPMLYFIGKDGRVLEAYSGYASEGQLRRRIEAALGK